MTDGDLLNELDAMFSRIDLSELHAIKPDIIPFLKPCPFCGVGVSIGVHDYEGNYQGELGCEYESAPQNGLQYALHHKGWGVCLLETGGADDIMGNTLFESPKEAAEMWNRRAEDARRS